MTYTQAAAVVLRDPPKHSPDERIVAILGWRRRHNTDSEGLFNNWLEAKLKPLAEKHKGTVERMTTLKQLVVQIPASYKRKAPTLFSCHVDTVDSTPMTGEHHQGLSYDPSFGHIMLDTAPGTGSVLGADDGVGIWIMMGLIEHGVPGTYVFHRGEECGGQGATAFLKECEPFLRTHKQAVAFDRPGDNEVIATQGGVACASMAYGEALAKRLNGLDKHFSYKVSHRGVFTDVKVYRGVIPECVNLGAGYEGHHSAQETLDYGHALALLEACKQLKWDTMPIERDPKKTEYAGHQSSFPGWNTPKPNAEFSSNKPWVPPAKPALPKPSAPSFDVDLPLHTELLSMTREEIVDIVDADPEGSVNWLISLALDVEGLTAKCKALRRMIGVDS